MALHNASVVKLPPSDGRMVASTRPRRLEVRVGAHGAVAIAPRALDAKPLYATYERLFTKAPVQGRGVTSAIVQDCRSSESSGNSRKTPSRSCIYDA